MAGRKPLPTAVKRLRGNPGKRALNKNEPLPKAGIPPCPDWLSDLARELWGELAPQLDALGILTIADGPALAGLCECYAEFRHARADVLKHGETYWSVSEDGSKMKRKNPSVEIASDSFKRWVRMLSEFGLTPSARSKLSLSPAGDEEDQKLAAFEKEGKLLKMRSKA